MSIRSVNFKGKGKRKRESERELKQIVLPRTAAVQPILCVCVCCTMGAHRDVGTQRDGRWRTNSTTVREEAHE